MPYYEGKQVCPNVLAKITVKDETHTIWSDGNSASFKCSHEKVDTRLVYQVLQAKLDVVNVVKGHRCPYSIDMDIQLV